MGDFNTKSTLWGNAGQNNRGSLLIELCAANNLTIVNDPLSQPTFQGHLGSSWIDLTMVRLEKFNVINWEVSEVITLSDHMQITFQLQEAQNTVTPLNRRYIMSKMNWLRLKAKLDEDLSELRPSWLKNKGVDGAVQELTERVQSICDSLSYKRPPSDGKKRRCVPWWSRELSLMLKGVKAVRRRFQRETSDDDLRARYKISYKRIEAKYKRKI